MASKKKAGGGAAASEGLPPESDTPQAEPLAAQPDQSADAQAAQLDHGGRPLYEEHPPTPPSVEIIPGKTQTIFIRGCGVSLREGKKTTVELDLLKVIEDAGLPFVRV